MGVPAYDIHALEVTLGGRRVLGPLDLRLEPGSFVGILGPNGSGKTTLLRTLTGALRPTAGEVLLYGRPVDRYRAAELARAIGVVWRWGATPGPGLGLRLPTMGGRRPVLRQRPTAKPSPPRSDPRAWPKWPTD